MIIYLSKSNRSNPNHVMRVREFIKNFHPEAELREYIGGKYIRNTIEEADYCFMVTEKDPEFISDDVLRVVVGKGLYTEAMLMIQKGELTKNQHLYYCEFNDDNTLSFLPVYQAKIKDMDNYISYGFIYIFNEEKHEFYMTPPKG